MLAILVLSLGLFPDTFSDNQVFLWIAADYTLIISFLIVCYIVCRNIEMKDIRQRAVTYLLLICVFVRLIDYTAILYSNENPEAEFYYTAILMSFTGLTILFVILQLISVPKKKSNYYPSGSYLLFINHSNSFLSLIASLLGCRGKACLIVRGKLFRFKNKKVIMQDYRKRKSHFLVRVENMDLEYTKDRLVGRRWTIFNNCYSTFGRYAKEWKL